MKTTDNVIDKMNEQQEKTNMQLIEENMKEAEKTMKEKCKGCNYYLNGQCLDHKSEKECWASVRKEE